METDGKDGRRRKKRKKRNEPNKKGFENYGMEWNVESRKIINNTKLPGLEGMPREGSDETLEIKPK